MIYKVKFLYVISFLFLFLGCNSDENIVKLNEITDNNDTNKTVITKKYLVKKTGQKYSYNSLGYVVSDNSLLDDGFYKKGISLLYTRGAQSVKDEVTHLRWQDNEDVAKKSQSWQNAKDYCEVLVLDGYSDWRLPTLVELESIIDYTKSKPTLDQEYFYNVGDDYRCYWSSTPLKAIDTDRWCVNFTYGLEKFFYKDNGNHVRCVRDEE